MATVITEVYKVKVSKLVKNHDAESYEQLVQIEDFADNLEDIVEEIVKDKSLIVEVVHEKEGK